MKTKEIIFIIIMFVLFLIASLFIYNYGHEAGQSLQYNSLVNFYTDQSMQMANISYNRCVNSFNFSYQESYNRLTKEAENVGDFCWDIVSDFNEGGLY